MVRASLWVGFTLVGMFDLPGAFRAIEEDVGPEPRREILDSGHFEARSTHLTHET